MIAKITRGDRMTGLMAYLVGDGRSNEHTDQRMVAGDGPAMTWWSETALDHQAALELGRYLDGPRKVFDQVGVSAGHVWMCSLSLRADEGQLSDTQWQRIAERFMTGMGFTDTAKAPVRWVAVRHGVSTNGNDHVHIVANWIREDGTQCFVPGGDYRKAQIVRREVEAEFGLRPADSEPWSERAYSQAEMRAQARVLAAAEADLEGVDWTALSPAARQARVNKYGQANPPRHLLAMRVRAAASASATEAEFVRRLRRDDLIVRPRFARGATDVIEGYSVARRPHDGGSPIWYGGGTLARDLALPRLRETWPDTAAEAMAAAAEWRAAARRKPPVRPGRETLEVTSKEWASATTRVAQLHQQLSATPRTEIDEWARVARDLSGALGAIARRIEPDSAGPITQAAQVLGGCAQRRTSHRPSHRPSVGFASITSVIVAASRGGVGPAAQVAMLRELVNLSVKLYEVHSSARDQRRSAALVTAFRDEIRPLLSQMQATQAWSSQHDQTRWMGTSAPGTTEPVNAPMTNRQPKVVTAEPTKGIER